MSGKKIIFVVSVLIGLQVNAADSLKVRNSPVVAEFMFGSRGMFLQAIVNKKLNIVPRLGFFSVTNLATEWTTKNISDYMLQGNITYTVIKGLDADIGFHWTGAFGIRALVGVMYTFADKNWLVVAKPAGYIDKSGNLEIFALTEYRPKIARNWRFYSRLQGDYCFTAQTGAHERSYVYLRAGVNYKELTFGAAANVDFYSPAIQNLRNYGGFFSLSLF